MSRRDWKRIAEVLRLEQAPLKIIVALADMFQREYGNFNRLLFIQAAFAGDLDLVRM